MNALLVSIAMATLGIDYGWQRLPEGGMLYIIQLKPEELDSLRSGQFIESDVPASAGEVRSYRIVVGRGTLPHETPPPRPTPPEKTSLTATLAARSPDPAAPAIIAPNAKPLPGQPALFVEPAKPAPAKPEPGPAAKLTPQEPAKPWLPLTLTLFGLFGSVGTTST